MRFVKWLKLNQNLALRQLYIPLYTFKFFCSPTYTVIYLLLFSSALYFGSRIVRQGPNLELPLPTGSNEREFVGEVVGTKIQKGEV